MGFNFPVEDRKGAIAEPLGVAIHAVFRAAAVLGPDGTDVRLQADRQLLAGKRVLVNGAGAIGSLVVAAAKYYGAEFVSAADLADSSLNIAQKMGADQVVNRAKGEDLPAEVDLVFEASGAPVALDGLFLAVRRGGRVVQVGNLPGDPSPAALGQLVTREIEYIGSYRFIDEISAAIPAMDNGLDIEPILTHEFPLDQSLKALETAGDKATGAAKVLLRIGD